MIIHTHAHAYICPYIYMIIHRCIHKYTHAYANTYIAHIYIGNTSIHSGMCSVPLVIEIRISFKSPDGKHHENCGCTLQVQTYAYTYI